MTAVTSSIVQLHIRCDQVPRAVAFYRDVLGLPFLFESGGLAFFQCGPTRLMLSRPEPGQPDHPGSIVYFGTDDIHAAHRALVERGAAVLSDPHVVAKLPDRDVWLCDWHDSEGNLMCLMEERRSATAAAAGATR
jgi:methylmalonyl-CoA/ethylmalonyl-CoA epimerase